MALRLDNVAAFAETLMVDEVRVLRNGRREDTVTDNWNETTGTYDAERVPQWQVYRGKGMVYTRRVDSGVEVEGGEKVSRTQYYCSLPFSMNVEILPEDMLQVLASASDPTLVNAEFIIETADRGTHRATREVAMIGKIGNPT